MSFIPLGSEYGDIFNKLIDPSDIESMIGNREFIDSLVNQINSKREEIIVEPPDAHFDDEEFSEEELESSEGDMEVAEDADRSPQPAFKKCAVVNHWISIRTIFYFYR